MRPEMSSQADFRERFTHEARAISALNHPHICTLYDIGEQAGAAYLVMEYVDGETLAARLRQVRSLSISCCVTAHRQRGSCGGALSQLCGTFYR